LLPDFLTVKVVLHPPHSPQDYRIITVVELKRNEDDRGKAEEQMIAYMDRIHEICNPNDSFQGFLIMEDIVEVYGYSGIGARRRTEIVNKYSMFAPGNPFTRDLVEIAIDHWN
jgi:hypothetical protein